MKRFGWLLVVISLGLFTVGCGGKDDKDTDAKTNGEAGGGTKVDVGEKKEINPDEIKLGDPSGDGTNSDVKGSGGGNTEDSSEKKAAAVTDEGASAKKEDKNPDRVDLPLPDITPPQVDAPKLDVPAVPPPALKGDSDAKGSETPAEEKKVVEEKKE